MSFSFPFLSPDVLSRITRDSDSGAPVINPRPEDDRDYVPGRDITASYTPPSLPDGPPPPMPGAGFRGFAKPSTLDMDTRDPYPSSALTPPDSAVPVTPGGRPYSGYVPGPWAPAATPSFGKPDETLPVDDREPFPSSALTPPEAAGSMGNIRTDAFGVPTNYSEMRQGPKPPYPTLENDPNIPQTPWNQLQSGKPMPSREDDKYVNMSRGEAAKTGFLSGLLHGNLLGGAINAMVGAISPSYGADIAFNRDKGRWIANKTAEEKVEQEDPVLQHRLAVATMGSEEPIRRAVVQATNEAELYRQSKLEEQRQQGRMAKAQTVADAALKRVQAQVQGRQDVADKYIDAKATLQLRTIAAGLSGNPAYDNLSDEDKATVVQQEYQRQRDQQYQLKQSQIAKNESMTDAQKALSALRDKQGNAIDDKIANPHNYYGGMTGNARYRAEMSDHDLKLKEIDRQLSSLEADHRANKIQDQDYTAKKADYLNQRKTALADRKARSDELLQQDRIDRANRGGGGNNPPPAPKIATQADIDRAMQDPRTKGLTRDQVIKKFQDTGYTVK